MNRSERNEPKARVSWWSCTQQHERGENATGSHADNASRQWGNTHALQAEQNERKGEGRRHTPPTLTMRPRTAVRLRNRQNTIRFCQCGQNDRRAQAGSIEARRHAKRSVGRPQHNEHTAQTQARTKAPRQLSASGIDSRGELGDDEGQHHHERKGGSNGPHQHSNASRTTTTISTRSTPATGTNGTLFQFETTHAVSLVTTNESTITSAEATTRIVRIT